LIATSGGDAVSALAAKNATSTIPIIFITADDPVATGLVASLARPGGNVTGVTFIATELMPKRFELLSELVPSQGNRSAGEPEQYEYRARDARRAGSGAREGGAAPYPEGQHRSEIDAAFATLVQLQAGALVVGNDPFFNSRRNQLVALASRRAVPAIAAFREFATSGGLISYGPSIIDTYRQLGTYAGKILKGAKPADLPVQQATKFELAVNLKTAKALGLTVPQSILARADEVIE